MANNRINPDSMYNSLVYGFSHAAVQTSGKTVHLAGQVAWDKDCNIVGGDDLAAQTRQTLANIKTVIEAAGGTIADIVRLRIYVVNHSPDKLGVVLPEVGAFFGAWVAGLAYDRTGSYDLAWAGAIALGLAAGFIHLPIRDTPIRRTVPA